MNTNSMTINDAHDAVNFLINNAPKYAKAKAERIYLDEWRKSKKALLMQESSESSAAAKEMDAYAHPEYLTVLQGIKEAVEQEETLRWRLVAAQARIEVLRSAEASARVEGRAVQ